jgi:Transposase DDE domain
LALVLFCTLSKYQRMHKHPKHRQTGSPKRSHHRTTKKTAQRKAAPCKAARLGQAARDDSGGFLTLFLERIGWDQLDALNQRKHAAGRPARLLNRGQLLASLVFHCTVSLAGTFGEHLFLLLGIQMAESTLSERRQALPFEVFRDLLKRMLRPIAGASQAACYRGLRLVGIDGVSFSLPNTEQVKRKCKKGGNQRGRAAFAKLQCSALVELVMHNPLAAMLGWEGESEWKLAQALLDYLPKKCLLLADRLYGCGAFIIPAMAALKKRQGHFLIRVKQSPKIVCRLKKFEDGSHLVRIKALDPSNHHRVAATMEVREIYAAIQRRGHRPVRIRLWTSLSCAQGLAQELVALYMSRWEQELYFRELKSQLGINDLLRSQTPETAAQEVATMIIGSSLIAHERAKLKPGEQLQYRISFIKTWETLEPLWLTLLLGADILSEQQKEQLCERFYNLAARRVMAKKRSRSCPRAMRQTMQPWPRKKNQQSFEGALNIRVC